MAVVLALAMVVVTGYGIGCNGLPLVGATVDPADLPLAGTSPSATPEGRRLRP